MICWDTLRAQKSKSKKTQTISVNPKILKFIHSRIRRGTDLNDVHHVTGFENNTFLQLSLHHTNRISVPNTFWELPSWCTINLYLPLLEGHKDKKRENQLFLLWTLDLLARRNTSRHRGIYRSQCTIIKWSCIKNLIVRLVVWPVSVLRCKQQSLPQFCGAHTQQNKSFRITVRRFSCPDCLSKIRQQ